MTPLLSEIKAVAFDFGDVIACASRETIIEFFQNSLGLTEEEFKQALDQYKRRRASGIPTHEFWIAYAEDHEITISPNWLEEYEAKKVEAIKPIPGMVELVQDLNRVGVQTPLLSNSPSDYAEVVHRTGLYDCFKPLLLSCDIGVDKPDSKAFELLLQRAKVLPQECVFVDDKQINVDAARALGIDAIQFTDVESLKIALQARGILVPITPK